MPKATTLMLPQASDTLLENVEAPPLENTITEERAWQPMDDLVASFMINKVFTTDKKALVKSIFKHDKKFNSKIKCRVIDAFIMPDCDGEYMVATIRCDAALANALLRDPLIYDGLKLCRMKPLNTVQQCDTCWGYGHDMLECHNLFSCQKCSPIESHKQT